MFFFLFNRDSISCRCFASCGQGELVATNFTASAEWQCAQEDVLVAPGGTPHGGLVFRLPRDGQRQVWPLTQFFLFVKIIDCSSSDPLSGKCFSLPFLPATLLTRGPLKGFLNWHKCPRLASCVASGTSEKRVRLVWHVERGSSTVQKHIHRSLFVNSKN